MIEKPINTVMGFLFNYNYDQVVLIKKKRPFWQNGFFNGVGGKIEIGETALQAMRREFKEETGLQILKWHHFCMLKEPQYNVAIFASKYPVSSLTGFVNTITDEEIRVTYSDLQEFPTKVMSNLMWLVPMAKDALINKLVNFKCSIKFKPNRS